MDRDELAAFLDSGVAMLGASADDGLRPEAFRVWGATIDSEGRVRALVSADAGQTLRTVGDGARLSLVVTDITTFRSVQLKGRAVGPPAPPGPDDVKVMSRYGERFTAKLHEIGHPARLNERIRPVAVFAVVVEVDESFDQTPGPRAGMRLPGGVA